MTKLAVINGVVFLLLNIMAGFMQINIDRLFLSRWLALPEELSSFIVQPWSLISYSFVHFGFFHILFNMLWMFFFGKFILNLFSEKRFLTVYLLGALWGGLLYMTCYNIFPAFIGKNASLVGASGSVTALMVFIAAYTPNTEIRIFTIRLKLWHIALTLVLLDLVRLPTSGNAGGLLAHLGGAAFGYVYAKQLLKGNDIGAWFEKLMGAFVNLFKSRKQKPFKKVHRNKATQSKSVRSKEKDGKSDHQKKVDTILDKIGKSGYESLTKAEKDFLFKSGENN